MQNLFVFHCTKYIILLKEYILFIGCLHYLSVHLHSCCFYNQHPGCTREITSMSVYLFCFKLCSILFPWWRTIRSFTPPSYLRCKKDPNFKPASPSPIFVAAPLNMGWRRTNLLVKKTDTLPQTKSFFMHACRWFSNV